MPKRFICFQLFRVDFSINRLLSFYGSSWIRFSETSLKSRAAHSSVKCSKCSVTISAMHFSHSIYSSKIFVVYAESLFLRCLFKLSLDALIQHWVTHIIITYYHETQEKGADPWDTCQRNVFCMTVISFSVPQGECQWVLLEFPVPVRMSELKLQFQGGFSGKSCKLEGFCQNPLNVKQV